MHLNYAFLAWWFWALSMLGILLNPAFKTKNRIAIMLSATALPLLISWLVS